MPCARWGPRAPHAAGPRTSRRRAQGPPRRSLPPPRRPPSRVLRRRRLSAAAARAPDPAGACRAAHPVTAAHRRPARPVRFPLYARAAGARTLALWGQSRAAAPATGRRAAALSVLRCTAGPRGDDGVRLGAAGAGRGAPGPHGPCRAPVDRAVRRAGDRPRRLPAGPVPAVPRRTPPGLSTAAAPGSVAVADGPPGGPRAHGQPQPAPEPPAPTLPPARRGLTQPPRVHLPPTGCGPARTAPPAPSRLLVGRLRAVVARARAHAPLYRPAADPTRADCGPPPPPPPATGGGSARRARGRRLTGRAGNRGRPAGRAGSAFRGMSGADGKRTAGGMQRACGRCRRRAEAWHQVAVERHPFARECWKRMPE